MSKRVVMISAAVLFCSAAVLGQNTSPLPTYPTADPMVNISIELSKISQSVQTLSARMKSFVDKFEKVGGITFNEKQQKLILGMELLVRAEQRVAALQKIQIEQVEKLNETRGKLAQLEIDLRPRNIERTTTFEGTTETVELRENRRDKLTAEKTSLTQLFAQIQINLAEATDNLREARLMAERLRRLYLPQIERELYEQ